MADPIDGGPAFPDVDAHGMSLRNWFAGQALIGCVAAYAGENVGMPDADLVARMAYAYADAMIRAGEKK